MSPIVKEITLKTVVTAMLVALVWLAAPVQAAPEIYDSVTGEYLGNLSSNQYDPNSVSNPYGCYGSQYSPDSINNPYSAHGSPYIPTSARNPYATQAPVIINRGR